MDVKQLAGRSHTVGRINIASELIIVIQAPIAPIVRPELFQVVDISAFDVKNFTEQTLLCHIQRGQLEKVVHTVLQLYTVFTGLFCRIDQCPDFIKRHGSRHFDSYMFAVLHRIDTHFGMMFPVCYDINNVDIVPFTQLLPGILRVRIGSSFRQVGVGERLLCSFHQFGTQITKGIDLNTGNMRPAFNGADSAHTQTDESNANCFHFRDSQPYHILLSGRPFRSFHFNRSINFPFFGLCRGIATDKAGKEQYRYANE